VIRRPFSRVSCALAAASSRFAQYVASGRAVGERAVDRSERAGERLQPRSQRSRSARLARAAYSGRLGHPFRQHPATRSGAPGRDRSAATGSIRSAGTRPPVPEHPAAIGAQRRLTGSSGLAAIALSVSARPRDGSEGWWEQVQQGADIDARNLADLIVAGDLHGDHLHAGRRVPARRPERASLAQMSTSSAQVREHLVDVLSRNSSAPSRTRSSP
jgi:hypothetical protein